MALRCLRHKECGGLAERVVELALTHPSLVNHPVEQPIGKGLLGAVDGDLVKPTVDRTRPMLMRAALRLELEA